MTGIWSRLFGMSGAEIYHNFRGGTGDDARGLIEAGGRLGIVRYRYAERTKSITELTTKMENAWRGGAAGAAQRGSGPLAVEHGLAEGGLTTANKTLYNQAQAFTTAKRTVTEIPPTPEKPGVWDNVTSLGGAGRNYENKVTQVNTANDHNVAVMEAYETTSSSNASAMPTTYGRITDDYSTVGVEKPPPPPQPNQTYPPTYPGSTTGNNRPGTSSTSSTSSTTGNTPTNPSGQKPPGSNTQNPPGTTTPSGNRPPVGVPPRGNLPGGNQNPGNQNQPLPGMIPPGYGPNNPGGGGGPRGGGGFGPRGSGGGFGPGGSGSGAGGPGAGGRGVGGGFGPGAGGAAAAESAAARGGPGGPGAAGRGGMGGMGGMGGGGRGQNNEDDTEHERPSFLVEPDPHETFGTDEVTAPPVIGE